MRKLITEKAFGSYLKALAHIESEDGSLYRCYDGRIVHYANDCSACEKQPHCQRYTAAADYCCVALDGMAAEKAAYYDWMMVAPVHGTGRSVRLQS